MGWANTRAGPLWCGLFDGQARALAQPDGDTSRVSSYSARFAGVVYPGETLRTRVWLETGRMMLTTSVVERDDALALSDAVLTVH